MAHELDKILAQMSNSKLRNYGIPGLASSLVGGGEFGKVRLFECERDHQEPIVPHSHRFDFTCLVLSGKVTNRMWTMGGPSRYQVGVLTFGGAPGQYEYRDKENAYAWWHYVDIEYLAGSTYSMTHDLIHSIYFTKDTRVLFFEGPPKTNETLILQPMLEDGTVIPTFKVEPWMFQEVEN